MQTNSNLSRTALAIVLFTAVDASGQRTHFGFVGGTNFTRDFPISRTLYQESSYPTGLTTFDLYSDTHSLIAGLSFELDLANNFSLEASALHRGLQLQRRFIFPDGSRREDGVNSVTTWQYPILLKYRSPVGGTIRPFVEAGPSFRTRHNPAPSEPSQFGGTVGAGAEFRAGRFRISPTLRYTRWQYDGDFPRIATKRDQIEFITSFSYATSVPSWRVGSRKLRFGLIGGTPITGGLAKVPSPQRIDELQGYIGGVVVELELNPHFSVEANGLYRPFRGDLVSRVQIPNFPPFESRFEFTIVTWQVPVLAKYKLRPSSGIRPFVEAGPSFRLSGNRNGSNPSPIGFTSGAGIESTYKALKISPVSRYTYWAADSTPGLGGFRTARHQVELLVGFTF